MQLLLSSSLFRKKFEYFENFQKFLIRWERDKILSIWHNKQEMYESSCLSNCSGGARDGLEKGAESDDSTCFFLYILSCIYRFIAITYLKLSSLWKFLSVTRELSFTFIATFLIFWDILFLLEVLSLKPHNTKSLNLLGIHKYL